MTLHVRVAGSGRQPLVLLHGWAFNSRVWDPLASALGAAYRLILVDLPGHGESPPPPTACSLAAAADTIADAVPEDSVWLGWSLGGLLALQAAASRPSKVAALLLVCSTPRFVQAPDWPNALPSEVIDDFHADLRRDAAGTLSRFVSLQVRRGARPTQTARALLHALRAGRLPWPDALATTLSWLKVTDLRPALGHVHCPTRVILGENDTLVPHQVLGDIRARRPDWQATVLQRAGHAPFLADPSGFAGDLLKWTRGHE